MGDILSVSLPSIQTCRPCECHQKCYAHKIERLRKNVREAYKRNLAILQSDPDQYWREVESAIMTSRFFRFHVSGDIPDEKYLANMAAVANRQSHCEILCFTKKYELVNEFVSECGDLPPNLHMVFSAWVGLEMVNPFLFPEAHVRFRDGTATGDRDFVECGGNCTECAVTDSGCWILKKGEAVIFNEH